MSRKPAAVKKPLLQVEVEEVPLTKAMLHATTGRAPEVALSPAAPVLVTPADFHAA